MTDVRKRSVIFDPPICHGLNGIMKLSHTHTLPPNPARAPRPRERPATSAVSPLQIRCLYTVATGRRPTSVQHPLLDAFLPRRYIRWKKQCERAIGRRQRGSGFCGPRYRRERNRINAGTYHSISLRVRCIACCGVPQRCSSARRQTNLEKQRGLTLVRQSDLRPNLNEELVRYL